MQDNRCVIDYLSDYWEERKQDIEEQQKENEEKADLIKREWFSNTMSNYAEELSSLTDNDFLFTEQVVTIYETVKKYYEEEI